MINIFFLTEDFIAHSSNVNCLALGHKSGRVLVTGGDDKKVNLWAVGKPNCIMVFQKNIIIYFLYIYNSYFIYVLCNKVLIFFYFFFIEPEWPYNLNRMCKIWPNRRFSMCWFTDRGIKNLGPGTC